MGSIDRHVIICNFWGMTPGQRVAIIPLKCKIDGLHSPLVIQREEVLVMRQGCE